MPNVRDKNDGKDEDSSSSKSPTSPIIDGSIDELINNYEGAAPSSIHEDTNGNNDANDNNSTDDSSGNDGNDRNANADIKVVIGDENNSTITSSATTEKDNIKVPSVILVGTQKGVSYQGLMYSLT